MPHIEQRDLSGVKRGLDRHPRFHIHFTPTSAKWLNMVKRFFRDLTVKRLRRGVFRQRGRARRCH